MLPIAAVILTDSTRTSFAGVDLNERAARIAHRAGIFDVHFAGDAPPSDAVLMRLRSAGWRITVSVSDGRPLLAAPLAETVVVIPARTIIEPAALVAMIREASAKPSSPALVVTPVTRGKSHILRITDGVLNSVMGDGNASSTGIAVLPEASLAAVRRVFDYSDAIHRLAKTGTLRALTVTDAFCATLDTRTNVTAMEREYVARTGGGARLLSGGLLVAHRFALDTLQHAIELGQSFGRRFVEPIRLRLQLRNEVVEDRFNVSGRPAFAGHGDTEQ